MRILITGGSGYIGSAFIKILKDKKNKKDQIYCISSKKIRKKNKFIKYKQINLNNYKKVYKFIKIFKPEILFHFAWVIKYPNYRLSHKNYLCLNYSKNLYEVFCKYGGKKAFLFGTDQEYNENSKFLFEKEIFKKKHDAYSLTKLKFYKYVKKMSNKYKNQFTWLRVFPSYGFEKENQYRLLPQLAAHYFKGRDYIIKNPEKIINIMHVKDLARAIYLLYKNNILGIVNLASYNSIKIKTIKDFIFGKLSKISYVNQKEVLVKIELKKLKSIGFKEIFRLDKSLRKLKKYKSYKKI